MFTKPVSATYLALMPSYFTSFINLYPDVYILIISSSISCCAILKPILNSGSFIGFIGLGYGLTSVISCAVGVAVAVVVIVGVPVCVLVYVCVLLGVYVNVGVGVPV